MNESNATSYFIQSNTRISVSIQIAGSHGNCWTSEWIPGTSYMITRFYGVYSVAAILNEREMG